MFTKVITFDGRIQLYLDTLFIRLNIILPSTPRSPRGFFVSGFVIEMLYTFLIYSKSVLPAHLILSNLITGIRFGQIQTMHLLVT
jgi:hypothetical protein